MSRGVEKWSAVMLLVGFCFVAGRPLAAGEKVSDAGKPGTKAPGASFADSLSLTSRHEPIHISSHDLEFRYNEKRIVYRGDVVAVQGDVTMKSDLLTVTYEEVAPTAQTAVAQVEKVGKSEKAEVGENVTKVSSKQRLKEIVAEGHVQITSGERRATGRKAVFNEAQRTVVLSGDAVVLEGGNQVTGERVTVYLDEKRSVVEGGSGERRAEMVLIPEQEGEGKKGAKKP
jgi:lipopolysaccharide export system protein LptA